MICSDVGKKKKKKSLSESVWLMLAFVDCPHPLLHANCPNDMTGRWSDDHKETILIPDLG